MNLQANRPVSLWDDFLEEFFEVDRHDELDENVAQNRNMSCEEAFAYEAQAVDA
jgi:hypothetical protein